MNSNEWWYVKTDIGEFKYEVKTCDKFGNVQNVPEHIFSRENNSYFHVFTIETNCPFIIRAGDIKAACKLEDYMMAVQKLENDESSNDGSEFLFSFNRQSGEVIMRLQSADGSVIFEKSYDVELFGKKMNAEMPNAVKDVILDLFESQAFS